MSTVNEQSTRRERSVLYIVVVVVLVVLGVIAVAMFRTARATAEAEDKAEQLIQSFEDSGIDVSLTPEQVARVLGTDGGATCANPNEALTRSILLGQLTNGAGGPGARPVIVEDRLFQGQLLIIDTYCPDEFAEFQEFVDSLDTVDGGE